MMDFLLLLVLVSRGVSVKLGMKCPLNFETQDGKNPWNFYKPGDHLIGIVTSMTRISLEMLPFNMAPTSQSHSTVNNFKLRIMIFAIQMINKNPQLLHNLTLGYNIHDNYVDALGTSEALMDILSTGEANVPNYSCGRKENLLALIDGAKMDISIQMSTLVAAYKIPQITDAIVSEALHDKSLFPFFHRILPKRGITYPAIVQVLLHFRWTLTGLFASDTEEAENFMRTFIPVLVRSGICVVIAQRFSATGHTAPLREALSKWRQVNVFVNYIEYASVWDRILTLQLTFEEMPRPIGGKIWIVGTIGYLVLGQESLYKYVHNIWSFAFQQKTRSDGYEDDVFEDKHLAKFEDQRFHCSFAKHTFSVRGRKRCTQKAMLESEVEKRSQFIPIHYHLHSIIKTLAYTLKAAYSSRSRRRSKKGEESLGPPSLKPWQGHSLYWTAVPPILTFVK